MTSLKSLFAPGLVAVVLALGHPAAAVARDVESDSSFTPRDLGSGTALSESRSDTLAPPPLEAPPAPSMVPPARSSDVLPFATNDLPRRPFAIGFGGGVGAYVADLGEVDRAFRTIEDTYRAAGVPIPPSMGSDLEPMVFWLATLHFEKVADVSVQLGRSNGDSDQLRTTGVLVSRRIASSRSGAVALAAGAGGGTYGFVFTRYYGATIQTYPDGGYDTLDAITLEGGGSYWTGRGSFLLRPGDHVAIDLQAQYLGMSETSTDTLRAGRISMDLSGYLFGASITFFL